MTRLEFIRRLNDVAVKPSITPCESMLIDAVCALSDHEASTAAARRAQAMTDEQQRGVVSQLAELDRVAHGHVQQLEDWRIHGRLRAELWARAYAAEFTGLRTNGEVRDHQDADHARQVARTIADAVAADFDDYCRERLGYRP